MRLKRSSRTRWRQSTAIIFVLFLVGCGYFDEKPKQGTIGYVRGFLGGVSADEPRAALIGREILSAGGTAADAAVAVYFALSVTLPSSASLGGGGICVVHDPVKQETKALDFLAGVPSTVPPGADRPSAIPGNPRGAFVLHARYGRLKWPQLVAPAANLARFGTEVSRAFATDLDLVAAPLAADAETRRIFGRANGGGLAKEGDLLRQVELAAVLERIRQHGPGDFYNGPFAGQLVGAVGNAGGSLSLDDLRSYAPVWRDPVAVEVLLGTTAYFAPPPAAAGAVAAEMVAMMLAREKAARSVGERPHLFVEAAARAFGDRSRWLKADGTSSVPVSELTRKERIQGLLRGYDSGRHVPTTNLDPAPIERPESPAATSFVVADREGQVVACALTMNNLFGTGRVAPGTGILLAALPGGGRGPTSLGPLIVHDTNAGSVIFAAGASGGVTAPTALVWVASEIVFADKNLENALASKRIHHGGHPDVVFYEPGVPDATLESLKSRGHQLAATPSLGKVNAVFCPGGLRKKPETCQIRPDPRGLGLATSAR